MLILLVSLLQNKTKMKNIILLVFAVTFITSCKKDYTCTCTNSTVTTTSSGPVHSSGESTMKFSKVSKKYAREKCISTTDVQTTGSGVNEVKVEKISGCVLS